MPDSRVVFEHEEPVVWLIVRTTGIFSKDVRDLIGLMLKRSHNVKQTVCSKHYY